MIMWLKSFSQWLSGDVPRSGAESVGPDKTPVTLTRGDEPAAVMPPTEASPKSVDSAPEVPAASPTKRRSKARKYRSYPSVPSTWMQLPTLAVGDRLPIVGEQNYQAALKIVAGGRGDQGTRIRYAIACLVREPNNPQDGDAVRIDIGGRAVAICHVVKQCSFIRSSRPSSRVASTRRVAHGA